MFAISEIYGCEKLLRTANGLFPAHSSPLLGSGVCKGSGRNPPVSSLPGGQEAEGVLETAWGKDVGPAAAQVMLVPALLCNRGLRFLCNEDLWLHSIYIVKLFSCH